MSQRLVCAAHNAKPDVFIASLHKSGNNCVERALSSGQEVRVIRLQREAPPAIVKDEAHAVHGNSRTEVIGYALNPARNVSFAVYYGQVRRVTFDYRSGRDIAISPRAGR